MTRKLLFGINILALLLLMFSFLVPLIAPDKFPILSLLSLLTLPIIGVNAVFAVYWLMRWDRRFFLSALLLIGAHVYFGPFVLGRKNDKMVREEALKVLSHNVHLFDKYGGGSTHDKMSAEYERLISEQQPDILCLQEYTDAHDVDLSHYPHQYTYFNPPFKLMGQAIMSRYPILNRGSLDFESTANNVIYTDLLVGNDTLRVYNVHLQSLGINPTEKIANHGAAEKLKTRISTTFVKQQQQLEQLLLHMKGTHHPKIIAGDFNNTAFSYVYREVAGRFQDTFQKEGHGLGATYYFNRLPLRIDFIFSDPELEVLNFETLEKSLSDHLPIIAQFRR